MNWGTDEEPLQAAAPPAAIPATVQAMAVRSQQLTIGGSALMVVAAYLAIAGALATSFARHELLLAAVAILAVSIAALSAGTSRNDRALRDAGVSRRTGIVPVAEPGTVLMAGARGILATITVIVLPLCMMPTVWLLPGVVAARTLGHPATGTAVADAPRAGCARCQDRTTFRTAAGALVTTRLAGVLDPQSDGAGTAVVYNSSSPGRAMSSSDYVRYGSTSRLVELVAVVGIQGAFLVALAVTSRRRRRTFGTGLGHVPIRELRIVPHFRDQDTWLLTFADGRSVSLQCLPAQNAQIIRRIELDPGGYRPDPVVWRALTTGSRPPRNVFTRAPR